MVDESWLVYLQNALCSTYETDELREKLRQLLDYKNPDNPFADNPEITQALIRAIDNLKVLDPAVGSGAFPMGILQKLVFVLGKLDPNNALWKTQQKEREIHPVIEDLRKAQEISYEQAREAAIAQLQERLAQIEADFANNEMDYARKLFLIENCIYGVDIQPIAVQIAKLRFFISLIVEQRVDDNAPNRGILPLPNLETKFIAANTLIGISTQLNLRSPEVLQLEEDLKETRRKHFTARTPKTKEKYRQQDESIRQAIGRLLKEIGLEPATADTFKYFRAAYGKKLRQFLTTQTRIHRIIDFGDAPVFTASVDTTILVLEKGSGQNATFAALNWEQGQSLEQFETVVQSQSFLMPQAELKPEGWQFADHTALRLLEKLRKAGTPLGEYVNGRFYWRIKTGLNEAFVVDRATRDRLIAEHPSSAEVLKPLVRGRDVKRWYVDYQDLWLLFIPWHFPLHGDTTIEGASEKAEKAFTNQYPAIYKHLLQYKTELSNRNKAETGIRYEWYALQRCAATYWQEFERSKIIYPDIYEHQSFAFDTNGFFSGNTCYFIPTKKLWLCGLLNSLIVEWFYTKVSNSIRGSYLRAFSTYIKEIPIPPASEQDRKTIEALVQKYISAKGQNVAHYEAEINTIVARLYGLTSTELAIIEGMKTQ